METEYYGGCQMLGRGRMGSYLLTGIKFVLQDEKFWSLVAQQCELNVLNIS